MNTKQRLAIGLWFGILLPKPAHALPAEEAWRLTPVEHRGRQGEVIKYECPPVAEVPDFAIWGTDYYTDDSSVCVAAVHWDRITNAGGIVYVQIQGPRVQFKGTERNGVTSAEWGEFQGSFQFVDGPIAY